MLLWLNRAPWPPGHASPHRVAQQPPLQTRFVPPTCSQLNPLEQVWTPPRDSLSHHPTFPSVVCLWTAFFHFLHASLFHFTFLLHSGPPVLLTQVFPFEVIHYCLENNTEESGTWPTSQVRGKPALIYMLYLYKNFQTYRISLTER